MTQANRRRSRVRWERALTHRKENSPQTGLGVSPDPKWVGGRGHERVTNEAALDSAVPRIYREPSPALFPCGSRS